MAPVLAHVAVLAVSACAAHSLSPCHNNMGTTPSQMAHSFGKVVAVSRSSYWLECVFQIRHPYLQFAPHLSKRLRYTPLEKRVSVPENVIM